MRLDLSGLCTGLLQGLLYLALRLIITAVESQWSHLTSDNNGWHWLAMATIIGLPTSDNTSHGRAPEPPHV